MVSMYRNNAVAPATAVSLTAPKSLLDAWVNIKLGFQLQSLHELVQSPIPVDGLQVSMSSVVG